MAPDPTVFVCPSCKAKLNAMQKTSMLTCSACGTEVDVKALRGRVTDTWNALEQEADQLQVGFVLCSLFYLPMYRVGGLQKTQRKYLYLSPPDMVNCLILSATPADFSTRWVFSANIYFPVFMTFSDLRQSSISGRLKGELEATRAICTRLKNICVDKLFLLLQKKTNYDGIFVEGCLL